MRALAPAALLLLLAAALASAQVSSVAPPAASDPLAPAASWAAAAPLAVPPPGAIVAPAGSSPEDIAATVRLPAATWYNDRDGNKVFDSLEERFRLDPLSTQPVIVTFRHATDVTAALARAQAAAGPFVPTHVFEHVGGFAASLRLDQALRIAELDEVRQVEWSQPGTPELATATFHMGVRAVQDHLGYDGNLGGLPQSTGEDVVIAILDTGFHGGHVDLAGKFLRFVDWSDGGAEKEPYDTGTHGTHVASIAGGLGVGDPRYTGVAPGAAFVGFQITGGNTKANAIASMDWIIENLDEVPVRISTISFGFGITVDGTDALELAMDRAWEAGVVTFKSNGNSGPEKGTTTIPGGARGILGIGSMHDPGEGGARLSSFSSRGPTADGRVKPDLVAPGSSITAADADSDAGYRTSSGTSMASPFAAGVAALMLHADPSLTNDEVRRILIGTAQDWGPPGDDVDFGHGRIDALRAVQQVLVERALREGWPYDRVAALDVELAHGFVQKHVTVGPTGAMPGQRSVERTTFEVERADEPVGLTVIYNGTDAALPGVGSTLRRAILVQVLGPDDTLVGEVSLSPMSRQQTFSFQPARPGTHTLEVTGLLGEERLFFDAGGPVPGTLAPSLIPLPEEYAGAATAPAPPASRGVPALPLWALLAGLAGLAVALSGHGGRGRGGHGQ